MIIYLDMKGGFRYLIFVMHDLTQSQLRALEKVATNAGTIVLGTLVFGRFLAPGGFSLTAFIFGSILYGCLVWFILDLVRRRKDTQ